ncbi:MAG: general secretion pathway protein GspK [Burkholderiaceae bacterium]
MTGMYVMRRQRGVAIITALVVVAAATVAVSAMMWRQSIAVRKVENQAALGEARWLARSAIEWARLVLLQDARTSSVDHLGEIWALPLAETRVTDDLATLQPSASTGVDTSATPFADNDAAFVSGRMRDAQARMNLNGLWSGDQADEQRLAMLVRLFDVLKIKKDLAKEIAERMGHPPLIGNFDALVADMQEAGTMDATSAERMRPYVVILPTPTPVNLNTASAEVLAACFTDLPLDAARALVRSREQAWFNQVSDAAGRLPGTSGQNPPGNVSVSSNYFEVAGRVRVGRADLEVVALIERDQSGTTRVRSMVER